MELLGRMYAGGDNTMSFSDYFISKLKVSESISFLCPTIMMHILMGIRFHFLIQIEALKFGCPDLMPTCPLPLVR